MAEEFDNLKDHAVLTQTAKEWFLPGTGSEDHDGT